MASENNKLSKAKSITVGYSTRPINATSFMRRTGLSRRMLKKLEEDYDLYVEWK